MRLIIQRETLLEHLQLIVGVVERRQTLPILSTVLMIAQPEQLLLVGTNCECELISRISLESANVITSGAVATPAQKLTDICRLLPENAILELLYVDGQLTVKSGRSRFVLSTFPSEDFPSFEEEAHFSEFSIQQNKLKRLIEKTGFAMAEQDVRYFLNGLQIQIEREGIRSVASDGHRLAFGALQIPIEEIPLSHAIIPRKAVIELLRLLDNTEDKITFGLSEHYMRVVTKDHTFTSKLIDSGFFSYHELIPKNCDKSLMISKDELKHAVNRIAVLSSEKIRGIRFQIGANKMKILANNMIQEYAEEDISVEYQEDEIEIAFSANYLLDALSVMHSELVELRFASSELGFLVKEPKQEDFLYVLMPIL